ncbi:zinc ribbon domain-containing protein YjdM [Ralstonia insidiosa]|jgi:protein PhnA|uniref:zinc ribbon domain-containing protein YjdM n=1 Tax=Ralstonia TaxID=48736 RepID=UPI000664B991|nr:zinc ribbon domain-containing protein YjdM [Ralstonia insidiosa]KMW47771.1 alkylphosphonate utilization protein [Ralstonia sp. MD27]MBX3770675.1 alkylphosphonate utilization protein [Ralstonia pickettii]NOZ19446.1 alkylphosphonate utilization protein [Betaproteobacteria bacterium]MBA9854837.1 alkylphosphonate utilization protein [Ralstonia insidiosa]MBA9868652.1 alkylphosphonate utilization protein [Ralstonia insidiosa]
MSVIPACPLCASENTYQDGELFICPDCAHEWNPAAQEVEVEAEPVIKDSNGNILNVGDSATLVKDLKLKGGSGTLKAGTKIKNIRFVAGDHPIDCKIDGVSYLLKPEFLKKA